MFGSFTFPAIPQQYRRTERKGEAIAGKQQDPPKPVQPRNKTNRQAGARIKTKAMQYMSNREFNDCITNRPYHPNFSALKHAIVQAKISTYQSIPRSVRAKINKELWKRPEVNDWLVGVIMDMKPHIINGRKRKDRCSDIKLHELEQMIIDYYTINDMDIEHEAVDALDPKMLTKTELHQIIQSVISHIAKATGASEIALRLEYQQRGKEEQ